MQAEVEPTLLLRVLAGLSEHLWQVIEQQWVGTLEVGVPHNEPTPRDNHTSHPVNASDMCTVQTIFPIIYLT